MIAWRAARRDATEAEVETALARLDGAPGLYFGCDAGIAGMHPLQATLAVAPALLLRVFSDGLEVEASGPQGISLLGAPTIAGWHSAARRGTGRHPIASLRTLLHCFAAGTGPCLAGALRFEAHQLRAAAAAKACLGFFLFPASYWERDASGRWQFVELHFDVPPKAGAVLDASKPAKAIHGDGPAPPRLADDLAPGKYAEMVAQAKDLLRAGRLVSLTLSQSYRRAAQASASDAFGRLRRVNPAPATFFFNDGLERAFGASPDLQLVVHGQSIESMPVCGTVARRAGSVGESESLRELMNEEVDAASLAVCSDAMRDDLASCCEPGTLELLERRRPMSLATVVHAVDRLRGQLRADADAWDAVLATTAPAMLTGAPRAAALEAIAQLEKSPRGWYGGLIVRVGRDGDAMVGTLLRAAVLHEGWAEVRTGGDLLADSDPAREEAESRHKALSLWRALGVEAHHGTAATVLGKEKAQRMSVHVHDAADPFPRAVHDALAAVDIAAEGGAANASVLIGSDAARCAQFLSGRPTAVVALGDAGCHMLASDGASLVVAPEHGRTLHCHATDAMPAHWPRTFVTARYAQFALADGENVPSGWDVWARDANGQPVLAVHPSSRRAALLFRPDSVLSDRNARELLRAAIAFVDTGKIAAG